jgi:hypothetical protein
MEIDWERRFQPIIQRTLLICGISYYILLEKLQEVSMKLFNVVCLSYVIEISLLLLESRMVLYTAATYHKPSQQSLQEAHR